MANTPIRNPVKRHGAYPNQKPLHPTDLSFVTHHLCQGDTKTFQLNGRTLLYPVLKRILVEGVYRWADAIGDLEIFFDDDLINISVENLSPCDLTLKFKIV